MIARKWHTYMAPLLACGLLVTACGGSTGGQSSLPPGCNQGATLINFWTSHTPPDSTSFQGIVDDFNKQSKDVCVKMTQVTANETDVSKLMTAVRGGTGPDVYDLDRFTVAQRAAGGLLQDLDQYGAKDLSSKYVDYAWKETLYNGKSYALPFDTDARALFYNKDLLQKAGVNPSVLDSKNGPATIDQIREIANKVNHTTPDGKYDVIGFLPWLTQGWHYTWGYDFGGSFFDQSSCKVTPTDPKIVEAYQTMFYNWSKDIGTDKVQSWISSYAPPQQPAAQDSFITGHIGMVVTGPWAIGNLKQYKPDLNYGITYIPVPHAGDQPSTWAGGWSNVIPQGAKNPKQAFEFVKYISGPTGQTKYTKDTNHLPTLKALYQQTDLFPGDFKFFVDKLLPVAKSRPPLPVGALYWDALGVAQDKAVLNKDDPKKSLQEAADTVNPKLQQYCPLK